MTIRRMIMSARLRIKNPCELKSNRSLSSSPFPFLLSNFHCFQILTHAFFLYRKFPCICWETDASLIALLERSLGHHVVKRVSERLYRHRFFDKHGYAAAALQFVYKFCVDLKRADQHHLCTVELSDLLRDQVPGGVPQSVIDQEAVHIATLVP